MKSGPPCTERALSAPRPRAAALIVLTIATFAAVATSPAAPSIESRVSGSATVDAGNPVVVQRVGIRVSREAMVPEILFGGVVFSVDGDGIGNALGDGSADPWLRITAVPDDPALLPESVRTREDGGEFFSVDSCSSGAPCEAEYTIVVEWLEAAEGKSLTVEWELEGSVSFSGEVPEGAEIDVLHLGEPETLSEPPPGLIPPNSPAPTP